jgi:hypothetical protein
MLFPHKVGEQVKPGYVLAECGICCVAVHVPVGLLEYSKPTDCETTIARPWPAAKAQ